MKTIKPNNYKIIVGTYQYDIGNVCQGYFLTKYIGECIRKKKLTVEKDGKKLIYDIYNTEIIPLQFGSGQYTITGYENIIAKKYQSVGSLTIDVKLDQENITFLYPNQYVNYNDSMPIVSVANSICEGLNEKASMIAIKNYIKKNYRYNYIKAATVKAGALPNIKECYEKKAGICQDLAAMVVCMLRSQNIDARFVIGYADKIYHAWVKVTIDGKRYLYDPTAAVMKHKVANKYTEERFY